MYIKEKNPAHYSLMNKGNYTQEHGQSKIPNKTTGIANIIILLGVRYIIISLLVNVLWLVNLVGHIPLYGPLKIKAVFVAKMFCDLLPSVLNFLASKSWKLSFSSEIVY